MSKNPVIPRIIDNNRKIFLDVLRNLLPEYKTLSIATGYWDLEAMSLIIDDLRKYKKVRLLIGREPLIPRHNLQTPEPDYPTEDIFRDLESLDPKPKLRNVIAQIKDLINAKILEVRVYKTTFLHAKCYIFGNYESENAIGVIGSSNFTKNGLSKNMELNALESDHRIVTFNPQSKTQEVGHLFWFDEFWNGAENWTGSFVKILETSPVGDVLYGPYETYIKTLYEIYQDELKDDDFESKMKGKYDLYDFQKKNAQALHRRLDKYGVAMLADSVGLGKTYTAIEVIKKYLESPGGRQRVEIICPKSLKKQWEKEMAIQGIPDLSPVVLQNPQNIKQRSDIDKNASVALFVIDESHNLRKTSGKRYDQVLAWIRNNPKSKVLLLTATPINNQLDDITNQVLLGAKGRGDVFKMLSYDSKEKHTVPIDFYQAIENLRKKISQDLQKNKKIDTEYIKQIMSPIIRAFVVRRTRQGIKREYGGLEIKGVMRDFPEAIPENEGYDFDPHISESLRQLKSHEIPLNVIYRSPPESIIRVCKDLRHPLDQLEKIKEEGFISNERFEQESPMYFIFQIILMLGFIPYRWRIYQTKYYGKTLEEINALKLKDEEGKLLRLQIGLYGILRTIFLKRMESSVDALRISVERYLQKLEFFAKQVHEGRIISVKDIQTVKDWFEADNDEFEKEVEDEIILDKIDPNKYALENFEKDLIKEQKLVKFLLEQIELLEKDKTKIKKFANILEKLNEEKPAGQKVLVFSYFADTIEYLEKNLGKHTKLIDPKNTAFLSSKNRNMADDLAGRFAPKAKVYEIPEGTPELRYLFSTDVLSEGQNLQDCGVLINYDLHWNPVRMIQRNGRINRLGSEYKKVYVHNMRPEKKLESYLKLMDRLEGKIDLIRATIGTDQSILEEVPNPIEFTDFRADIYSEEARKRKAAMDDAERATDFLLSEDEFILDLKEFHEDSSISEEYRQEIYKGVPKGKWAAYPHEKHKGEPRPKILSLSCVFSTDECSKKRQNVGTEFVSINNEGNAAGIPPLQALEWLKTSRGDSDRVPDRISVNRQKVAGQVAESVMAYQEADEEEVAPVGQQRDVLRILYENEYPEKDIDSVQKAYTTRNVIDKRKIQRLVARIARAKRGNKPFVDLLKELIGIASDSNADKMECVKVDSSEQLLFYSENK